MLRNGRRLGRPVPRHLAAWSRFEGERGLLSVAFPPDYAAQRPLLRLLHGQAAATSGSTNSTAAAPTRAARGSRRAGDRDPPPGQLRTTTAASCSSSATSSTSAPATAAPAATRRTTPRTGSACSASCCGSTRGPPAGGPTRSPPPTRSSAGPAATRSTATACATRSASPSTRSPPRQPRIAIGDVGQNRFEELDYTTVARRRRRQLRLGRLRGLRPLPRRKQRHARPGRHREADLRLPPQPRRQLLDHRRLRGRATAACRSLYGRYVYADLCEGQLRSLVPHLQPGQRRPQARPLGRSTELLRRRRPAAASTSPRSKGPVYRPRVAAR